MSNDAISVVMQNNLVAGVERLGYRIQGDACPGTVVPSNIKNSYWNNEVHSAMAGVSIWSEDTGFIYDTECILISGFKTYKGWYYGLFLETSRNIIVDSCAMVDGNVGILSFVIGPAATTHEADNNFVYILNSIVVGAMTPNDCNDIVDLTTTNTMYTLEAIPTVSATSDTNVAGGQSGIVFPFIIGGDNMMPYHSWPGIDAYPCVDGYMNITNVTLAYFNDICGRRDIAIQVAQHNDDGQFPIRSSQISLFNTSYTNLIFNGRPNLDVVGPSDCVDMDCDGLKKDLLVDLDGTLVGQPSSLFSQAEYDWGDEQHGVGDFFIPLVAMTDLNGTLININLTYPYRGISRGPTCSYQPLWQMYLCTNKTDYRMLIIESMDIDTETRRLSPVAIMSSNGYIDLINGPQDHGWCNGYTCQKRISTFMALVEGQHQYDIYLSSTQPNQIRFRLVDSDASIIVSLALHYDSLQQIDVYANGIYVAPINRDMSFPNILMLLDTPNNLTYSSAPGSNYFNRTYQMANFIINGGTVIDLEISELIVLSFCLPETTPTSFYSTNLVANLAALLGVNDDMIRRVDIVSASSSTRLYRRQTSLTKVRIEMRYDPIQNLSANSTNQTEQLQDILAKMINRYQSGELQTTWSSSSVTGYTALVDLNVQEPRNQTTVQLSIIAQIKLIVPPASCREQSPCETQPVLVAYDSDGNIIDKLGSNNQPWQIVASVVGQTNVILLGSIANYSNGQSQYTTFAFSQMGNYQVQFAFIQPNGVSSSFVLTVHLTANTTSIGVTQATLAGKQINAISVVSVNELFNLSGVIVDSVSALQIGNIRWRNFTWSATVSLYTLPQYNPQGVLISNTSSPPIIDYSTGILTIPNLSMNATGMYILKMTLTSSNGEYSLQFTSSGILVKENTTVLTVDMGAPVSYIQFNGDYDALQANNLLEMTRAVIYNYLLSIGLPIISDITIYKGSVISSFVVGTNQTGTAAAVNSTLSNPNAISNMPTTMIVINDKSFNISSTSTSDNLSQNTTTIALIVGLVVGIGGSFILLGLFFAYRKYDKKHKHRRLMDDFNGENIINNPVIENTSEKASNTSKVTRRIDSPLPLVNEETSRVPSASLTITMLDAMEANKKRNPTPTLSAIELINFD